MAVVPLRFCSALHSGAEAQTMSAVGPMTDSTTGAEKEGRASPIDAHVGSRIRLRRTLMGMSQERLGEALGLTFQQVQKYERGVNRVGASRLFDLSRVLDVPIGFFFDDMPPEMGGEKHRRFGGFQETQD